MFFDEHKTGSPFAKEALDRIGALYGIEANIRGKPPDDRKRCREEKSLPPLAGLKAWLETTLPKLSGKSDLAKAMRYTMSRWDALTRYPQDDRVEITGSKGIIWINQGHSKLCETPPVQLYRDGALTSYTLIDTGWE